MHIDGRTLSHEVSEQMRLLAVRRVRDGERSSEVMRSYGLCRTTIYRWLRTARRGGEQALRAQKALGPTRKLTARQRRQQHPGRSHIRQVSRCHLARIAE